MTNELPLLTDRTHTIIMEVHPTQLAESLAQFVSRLQVIGFECIWERSDVVVLRNRNISDGSS